MLMKNSCSNCTKLKFKDIKLRFKNKKLKFKKSLKSLLFFLLFVSPISVYIYHFHDYEISKNPSDWGNFGDYIGGVYSILVTVLAIYLSRILSKKDIIQMQKQAAAEYLYKEICKIKSNNVNLNSVVRFQKDINTNSIYLPDNLVKKLIKLADNFIEHKSGGKQLNLQLETTVLNELKQLYNE